MDKKKILKNIEEGLLDYYLSLDYNLKRESIAAEREIPYGEKDERYSKLAKQILFKAKLESKKSLHAKVISLSEASDKLSLLDKEMEGKVFSIFKKHVEEHGLAANYRNFEAMTEEEMKEILEQLNHTALVIFEFNEYLLNKQRNDDRIVEHFHEWLRMLGDYNIDLEELLE